MTKKLCQHVKCGRPVRANGYCSTHSEQLRRKGCTWDVVSRKTARIRAGGTDVCLFPDCGRSHFKAGYCESHARQLTRGESLTPLRLDRVRIDTDENGIFYANGAHKFYFDEADKTWIESKVWTLRNGHLYHHRTQQYLHKTMAGLSTHDGYRYKVIFLDGDPTNYRRANLETVLRTRGKLGERGITTVKGAYQVAVRVEGKLIVRRRNKLEQAIQVRDHLLSATSYEAARRLTNARSEELTADCTPQQQTGER